MSLAVVIRSYLGPMQWRYVRLSDRIVLVALSVVLSGQVDVLAFAHQHAADQRGGDCSGSRGTFGRIRIPWSQPDDYHAGHRESQCGFYTCR